jgi:hypothetical protein
LRRLFTTLVSAAFCANALAAPASPVAAQAPEAQTTKAASKKPVKKPVKKTAKAPTRKKLASL